MLGIDFLRKFGVKLDRRGSCDLLSQPGLFELMPRDGLRDSAEIKSFIESYTLRDPKLTQIERAILILHFQWGFVLREIADVFNLSEGRVSQMLKEILRVEKKRIKND